MCTLYCSLWSAWSRILWEIMSTWNTFCPKPWLRLESVLCELFIQGQKISDVASGWLGSSAFAQVCSWKAQNLRTLTPHPQICPLMVVALPGVQTKAVLQASWAPWPLDHTVRVFNMCSANLKFQARRNRFSKNRVLFVNNSAKILFPAVSLDSCCKRWC